MSRNGRRIMSIPTSCTASVEQSCNVHRTVKSLPVKQRECRALAIYARITRQNGTFRASIGVLVTWPSGDFRGALRCKMEKSNGKSASEPRDPLDRATAARLAQLKNVPLDLSKLESRLRAEIEPPSVAACGCRTWLRAHRLILGVVLVVAVIVIVLLIAHQSGQ
jgi:hypothetical protein